MNIKKQNKDTNTPLVTYVKLSVHYRKYLQSRYGKKVVSLPLYSPLYGCIEQYLINNASLSYFCYRSCSQFVFQCHDDCFTPDGRSVLNMKPAEIQNFQRVFFLALLAKNCNFMKLDILYLVVFQSLMKKATKCSLFPFISTF